MRGVTHRCPSGCRQSFERVTIPGEDHDQFLCNVCGKEVSFAMPMSLCKCGSQEYIMRPQSGQSIDKGYLLRCVKCCEYVTVDSLFRMVSSDADHRGKT